MLRVKHAHTIHGWTVLFAALWLGMGQAQAHAKLLSASPAADSSVAAVRSIELQFSEEIALKFSSLKLIDAAGAVIAVTAAKPKDAKSLAASPVTALAPGLYTVSWTAVATDDGHKTMGSYHFTVK